MTSSADPRRRRPPPRRQRPECKEHRDESTARPSELLRQQQSRRLLRGHGVTTREDRGWEEAYRKRWQHDKIVRSTHGANCTGSCSWKIYVKGGIVTWETQQTDYPRTRPDLPNHEPRGCSRGASYSWYLYSGNRVKYPLVRSRLIKLWREARATLSPVAAWKPRSSRTRKSVPPTPRSAAMAASSGPVGTRSRRSSPPPTPIPPRPMGPTA